MHEAPELNFIPGLVVKEEFFDYKSLQNGAKNYHFISKFRLGKGPFYGIHSGIQLKQMQVGYADRHEGLMYEGWSPKGCITIGVLKQCEATLNVNRLKMYEGETIVIDDSAPHLFAAADRAVIATLSIEKELISKVVPKLLDGCNRTYKDKRGLFSKCLSRIAEEIDTKSGHQYSEDEIDAYEAEVLEALTVQFTEADPIDRPLNEYETIIFDVKDFILANLKEDFSIRTLTEQFSISDKTLEKHFSALFGITPKKLITMLKLNQAHEELCCANELEVSVTDIAQRWGFSHLGRFANDYKDIFGTLPSEDLKRSS